MVKKKLNIKLVLDGYAVFPYFEGTTWDNFRVDGQGEMVELPANTKWTKQTLLSCVNDHRFGLQSIDKVEIVIYAVYKPVDKLTYRGYINQKIREISFASRLDYHQYYTRGI